MLPEMTPPPAAVNWRAQFEWLASRSLQLDTQLQPVKQPYLVLLGDKYRQMSEAGKTKPAAVLIDFVSKLFEGMGADKMAWEKEPKVEAMPLLAIGDAHGFLLLHARNSDGSWMAETPTGLQQLAQLPGGLSFSGVIGRARRKNRGTARQLFAQVLREHKSYFMFSALATVIMNLLALVTSLYSMQVYDRVIPSQGVDTLFTLTSGVLISIVLETMTKFMRSSIMDQAIERMDVKLSYNIFDRLLRVRMDQFPASVGTLSGQLRSYEMIRSFISSVAVYLIADTPFALLFLAVIFMVGGTFIAAIPLTFFLICLGLGFFFKGRIEAHAKASQAASNRKLGLLVEAVETAEFIKASNAAWHFQGKWNALTRQTMTEDSDMRHISESNGYYAAALQQISYVMLVGIGAYIASTSTSLTSGALIACSILSGRVLQPVASLPGLMVQWANAKSSMGSLEGVFKLEQDNHDVLQALTLDNVKGDFRLENVTYAYPGRPQSLDVPNLQIRAGEKVGVVGAIGGGKTTLLKVLSGLYRPQKGRALLDSLDMQHIARSSLSKHIGYRPVLLNLSRHDLRADAGNVLEFRQVGHLRGWPVLPVLFGEVAQLRPVYELVFYLTETLSETINYLCGFVGVFLIAMGAVGRERKYLYAGLVAVIWVLLFKLALLPEQPMQAWYAWRLALYALTGNLILCAVLFLLALARIRPGRFLGRALVAVCQLGWVVFLVAGKAAEFHLDLYWVGGVVVVYVLAILATFRRSHFHRWVKPIFVCYLVASGVLAAHDFLFQAGFVWDLGSGLSAVFANAVYLSHFTLPVFLWASCTMLLLEYIHRNQQAERIRDEILNDIHDGVGARLNVLLMGLELKALDGQAVKNDVRRCIDELRFVLLPDADKTPFLVGLMEKFCVDVSDRFHKSGIDFHYAFHLPQSQAVSPKVALVLYFSLLECLSNVVKHAASGARAVRCVLHGEGERVTLHVEDDGPGIAGWSNAAQAFALADARQGLGLKSLRARVAGAGGRISILSEAGAHTRVRIEFSLKDGNA